MQAVNNIAYTKQSEQVYIETSEHKIIGEVFFPKVVKANRLISELLNQDKKFLAIKDCKLEYKDNASGEIESHEFITVNLNSIILLRPYNA